MIEEARENFDWFVEGYEKLYTESKMNYNIHLLLHITDTVVNWGPLFHQNTFHFENENRLLLKNKKSNYKVMEQIINKKLFYQNVPLLCNQNFITEETRDFCNTIKSGPKLKIGIDNCDQFAIKSFNRILYNGFRVTSTGYKRLKKTCNSCFEISNEIVIIRNILFVKSEDTEKVLLIGNPLILLEKLKILNAGINHITCFEENLQELKVFEPKQIKSPVVLSIGRKKQYVFPIPKGCLASEH